MAPAVQAKFLRVLQEREFQRLGGTRTLKADIRVVAATNRDLRRAMEAGEFREVLERSPRESAARRQASRPTPATSC